MHTMVLSAVAAATAALSLGALAQSPAAPVDPNAFLNQFEATFGKFEGYRRSGAKGICATGEFVGTADARGLSSASAFSGQPVQVVARFSVGGANPKAPDNTKGQRNMALQFNLPGGESWQMGNISAPVFGSSSPQQKCVAMSARAVSSSSATISASAPSCCVSTSYRCPARAASRHM